LSSMNACSAHHIWDSYMACLKLTVVCSGTTVTNWLPKLSCLGHLKKLYKLVILKIKDLKTVNRDCKKATKQGNRYCSVGIQFLSYKSLF